MGRSLISAVVCLGALTTVASAAWQLHTPRLSVAPTWTISGQPLPPPPSHLLPLLPRFAVLLQGYIALDGAGKLPFGAWVVANGITDPVVVQGMVELYVWVLRGAAR